MERVVVAAIESILILFFSKDKLLIHFNSIENEIRLVASGRYN
jgi:hypothetical protein